jgi:hypothetical protein
VGKVPVGREEPSPQPISQREREEGYAPVSALTGSEFAAIIRGNSGTGHLRAEEIP